MAILWLLRDGEQTADIQPAATGTLADLQRRFRIGDLTHLRVAEGSVRIGPPSSLQRKRHAVVLLDQHEGEMRPGYYAGRYSEA